MKFNGATTLIRGSMNRRAINRLDALMQAACCNSRDRHLPTFLMDNFVRRSLFPPEKKISKFISSGIVIADIGCGPGCFTIPMAELVGARGKVCAIDSDPKSIMALNAKLEERRLQNIVETQIASAANLVLSCRPFS